MATKTELGYSTRLKLGELQGRDDIACPVCDNNTLDYECYTLQPTTTSGESVSCTHCKFYAEHAEAGKLVEFFDLSVP